MNSFRPFRSRLSIFNKAITWKKATENPARPVKLLREDNRRLRYLDRDQARRLVTASLPHLRPILVTALNTGMRKGEILPLTWDQVDLTARIIRLTDTKNGEGRDLPINDDLLATLQAIPRHLHTQEGKDGRAEGYSCLYVFCDGTGQPFGNVRRSFETASREAEITDFRFHDLRHTFASWLVMNGTDLNTVKELLGHKTIEMTLRYAHLSPDHKRRAVAGLWSVPEYGTKTAATSLSGQGAS